MTRGKSLYATIHWAGSSKLSWTDAAAIASSFAVRKEAVARFTWFFNNKVLKGNSLELEDGGV
jgi:hypothetical protein